jgi:hypothetical protein
MQFRKAVLALCLAVFAALALAGEPVALFQEADGSPGKIHPLTVADLNPHLMDGFWYTENWFFIAVGDDGHIAYVNLMLSNLGLKKHQPALSFTIITPDRKRHTTEAEFNPEDLQWSRDHFALRIGGNVLDGDDQTVHLKLYNNGLGLDLTFTGKMRGYQMGDGKGRFGAGGSRFYYINYPAPRPEVTGTLTVNDWKLAVHGWGYVDHCYYNANATDFEDVWHNWKFHSPEISINLSNFTTPARFDSPFNIASILDDQGVVCVTTDVTVTGKDVELMKEGGKPYPQTLVFDFRCADGTKAHAVYDGRTVVEALDVLAKLNQSAGTRTVKYLINTFIAAPFYYRAIAPVEVQFTRHGETKTIKGQAVSEVIFTK